MQISILLLVGCVLGLTTGQAPDMYGIINILYMKADPDMDGKISQANLTSVYMGFDTDGSGDVSKAEFVSAWRSLTLQSSEMASAWFDMSDKDHNGVVDVEDTKIIFSRFDKYYDGMITDREFVTRYKQFYHAAPFVVLYRRLQARLGITEDINEQQFSHLFEGLKGHVGVSIDKASLETKWVAERFGTKEDADEVLKSMDRGNNGVISGKDLGYRFSWLDTGVTDTISVDDIQQILNFIKPEIDDSVLIHDTQRYRMKHLYDNIND